VREQRTEASTSTQGPAVSSLITHVELYLINPRSYKRHVHVVTKSLCDSKHLLSSHKIYKLLLKHVFYHLSINYIQVNILIITIIMIIIYIFLSCHRS